MAASGRASVTEGTQRRGDLRISRSPLATTSVTPGGGGVQASRALDPGIILGIAAIVTSMALQCFGVPYKAMQKSSSQRTEADKWAIVVWCLAWLPVIFDACLAMFSPSRKFTRFQGRVGPFMSSGAGIVSLGCGAKAVHEIRNDDGYNGANEAEVLLPTFPYVLRPLVLAGLKNEVGSALNVLLWLVDMTSDIGMGVAKLLSLNAAAAQAESRQL